MLRFLWGAGFTLVLACLAIGSATALSYREDAQGHGVVFQLAGEVHPDPEEMEWPAFPEIMGGGACWFDADGDGYEDLYVVNQRYNPENPATWDWGNRTTPTNALFLNDGTGHFQRAAASRGVDSEAWGYGCSAADHDGDGDTDLYVANFGMNELFENQGNGTFVNVTAEAGVGGQGWCSFEHRCMSTSSGWADYDLDGDLDLYVANYVDTNLTDLHLGPPEHEGQVNFLFQNEGDGTFTEVAAEAGVQGNPTDLQGSKSLGVVWFDHDQDGDQDLYVANDQVPNDFYENNGDGTFTERSDAAGLADDRAGMGVTAGDYDRDGYEDLFFTHYRNQENGLYRNLGDGTFEDRSGEDDLTDNLGQVGWGTGFLDADRDGDLDLVVANGHTSRQVQDYDQGIDLFLQDPEPEPAGPGDVAWRNASGETGLTEVPRAVTRGLAAADPDLDGDTDIVLVNNANQSLQFLEAQGPVGNTLSLTLHQPGANPDGIGARVTVEADGTTQTLHLRSGTSYLSKDTGRLDLGLGEAALADRVEVHWPDGGTSAFTDVAAGQALTVDRATGALLADTFAPETEVHVQGEAGLDPWWVGPVEVTLAATDRGVTRVSGVTATELGVDGGPLAAYDGEPFMLETEGVHRVTFRSVDADGNWEPVDSRLVRLDLSPPAPIYQLEGTRGENGWWTSPEVRVRVDAVDETSGVAEVEIKIDHLPWVTYNGSLNITGDGVHTLQIRATDHAGLTSPPTVIEIPIDTRAPELTLHRPAPGTVYLGDLALATSGHGPPVLLSTDPVDPLGGATFTLLSDAYDATSGLTGVAFRLDGEPLSGLLDSAPFTWPWSTAQGASGHHLVEVVGWDAAGHEAVVQQGVVLVSASQEGVQATMAKGPSTYGLVPGAPQAAAWPPGSTPWFSMLSSLRTSTRRAHG